MAITSSCCLNLLPAPPPRPPPSSVSTSSLPSSTTKFTHQHSCRQLKNDKWKRQCVVGMACMLIGLEMNNFAAQENLAMAIENISVAESKERWSEKLRSCPSWRLNPLETIVPENLPRPSARRRWQSVRHSQNIPAPSSAPAVKFKVKTIDDCFTM